MTQERKELIKKIEDIRQQYINETCPVMKDMFKDIKKKYNGKTIKFLKNQGVYLMIDKVSMYFDDSVMFEGTKIMGPNLMNDEKLVLPLSELKDEYFQVIEDKDMAEEFENLLKMIIENVNKSKKEKEELGLIEKYKKGEVSIEEIKEKYQE